MINDQINHKVRVTADNLNTWATDPHKLFVAHYTMDIFMTTGGNATLATRLGVMWEEFKRLLALFEQVGDEAGEEIEAFADGLVNLKIIDEAPYMGIVHPGNYDYPPEFEYKDEMIKAALEELRDVFLLAVYVGDL